MPINRNALIRYKVIDSCLQRRNRKWTLVDLIDAVSEALYEYEGMEKGISKRSIQSDIQMMRSDKLGYFAPIIVEDRKFYTYEDPNYSITNIPLSENDLSKMNEAVELLKEFKGFSHFSQLSEVVQKLEDHVYSKTQKSFPVIDFEKNDNLKGLHYLDTIYKSIISKRSIKMEYQSFKARDPKIFNFHVWWLKEFKNRWFAVGVRDKNMHISTLALDRIVRIDKSGEDYLENSEINPSEFYKDVFGVTVSKTLRKTTIKFHVFPNHAPYIKTKPIHSSQEIIMEDENGITFSIKVQLNFEIERELLGYADGLIVISPPHLKKTFKEKVERMKELYNTDLMPDQ